MHLQVRTEHVANRHCFNIVSALQLSPWSSAVGVRGEDFKSTHRTSPYSKGTALISYFGISNGGFRNHGGQAAAAATTFFKVAPNICGSSIWNLIYVTLLVTRNMRWLLDFWKICTLFL